MAQVDLNKSVSPPLAERIGFLLYRLSRSFHSRHLFAALATKYPPTTSYGEISPGSICRFRKRLIGLFNKFVDATLKVVESVYPFATERPAKIAPRSDLKDKLKDMLSKPVNSLLDLTESIYLFLLHPYRLELGNILARVVEAVRKRGFLLVIIIFGYLLAQGVFAFSPRHIVVYVLLPICVTLVAMKPIYGLMLYLILSISALQAFIWNFPATIFGVTLFLTTPILFATMLSWLIEMTKKKERIKGIYDSNNLLIVGFWGFLTLSFLFTDSNYFVPGGLSFKHLVGDYLPYANWIVLFFTIIYVVGDDKKRFFYLLYTVAGIYGYFAIKVMRWAAYFGFGTEHPVTAGLRGGQLSDNNELAACLVMALPIFYALFLCQKTKPKKAIFLLTFIVGVVAVIYTRSRGGLLGLLILSVPLFFKLMFSTTRNKVIPVILAAVLVTAGYGLFHEKIERRIESIENWREDASAQNRIVSVIVAWNMMKDSPILGQGGISDAKFKRFLPDEMVIRAGFDEDDIVVLRHPGKSYVIHNAYASLGGQYGVPALIFFIWLIFHSMGKLRRLRKQVPLNAETEWIHYVSHALELSILGYAVTALFLNNPHQGFIYVVYGLTSSLCYIALKPTRKHNFAVSLTALILFGCWLYFTVWYRA
jgi:probable O-glycosylation ligase (exosortase A-associated)